MILKLTLIRKWFLMIQGGIKKEEYREIKWFWIRRFWTITRDNGKSLTDSDKYLITSEFKKEITEIPGYKISLNNITEIEFYNGGYYSKDLPWFSIPSPITIRIGQGNPDWGAPEKKCNNIRI